MKGIILVGGEGTRLRPLTCNIPKAVVPVLNRPFLEHLLLYLKKHGVQDVILAMGYLPDPIESRLGDGSHLGVRLNYLVEDSPLGTAGAVKNAEAFLDEPFVVFNGDIITEIDLTAMIRQHQSIKPIASIALTPVDNPTLYGVVETNPEHMVKRFIEKPTWDRVTTNMINAGIYVLEPDVLQYIPPLSHCMFEDYLFPRLLDIGEPVLSYSSDAYWIDIGTPEKYLKVHHDLLLKQGDNSLLTEGESNIHPSARIEGPVLLAEECTIGQNVTIKGPSVFGPRCRIARGSIVEGAVLWEGTHLGENSVLQNCIAGSGCRIAEECYIPDDCILGDNTEVNSGSRLTPGTSIWPDSNHNHIDTTNYM